MNFVNSSTTPVDIFPSLYDQTHMTPIDWLTAPTETPWHILWLYCRGYIQWWQPYINMWQRLSISITLNSARLHSVCVHFQLALSLTFALCFVESSAKYLSLYLFSFPLIFQTHRYYGIDQIYPYPTKHQKSAQFFSGWCILGYRAGTL